MEDHSFLKKGPDTYSYYDHVLRFHLGLEFSIETVESAATVLSVQRRVYRHRSSGDAGGYG